MKTIQMFMAGVCTACALMPLVATAREYFVATDGDDAADGWSRPLPASSSSAAWRGRSFPEPTKSDVSFHADGLDGRPSARMQSLRGIIGGVRPFRAGR